MIVYLSGGSSIPETHLPTPTIMLSYYVNASKATNEPDRRLREILEARMIFPKTLKCRKGKIKCKTLVHRKVKRKKK
jgi:hypothetical protein